VWGRVFPISASAFFAKPFSPALRTLSTTWSGAPAVVIEVRKLINFRTFGRSFCTVFMTVSYKIMPHHPGGMM
jgi:hypothetical protein